MNVLTTHMQDSNEIREKLEQLADAASAGQTPEQDRERIEFVQQLMGESISRKLGIYALPDDFKLSVVIPVFNEIQTLADVISRIRKTRVPCEIILVDDGSTDGTRELLESWQDEDDLRIIFHEVNQGKGAALKTGFMHVSGDAAIIQDADLEYDPFEYRFLLQPIIQDGADAVFGSRFSGHNQRVLYFWHYVGNRVLTTMSNCFTNLNLTDMETCYKVFTRETIERIAPTLHEKRFGIEPEMTAKLASIPGVRIFERPISYSGRTYAEGKKITWRDGISALRCIVRYRKGLKRPR